MDRTHRPFPRTNSNAMMADRLCGIRQELYGPNGAAVIAEMLGIPLRTWTNYEQGVTMPAELMLLFLELTGVRPQWLLHGTGEKFQ